MSPRRVLSSAALAVLPFSLAACGGEPAAEGEAPAPAADDPPVIEQRQENFETIGDSFKAIRTQLEGDSPDMTVITEAATDLNAAALKVEGFFPEGTSVDDGYDTEALAAIWEKPEQFAEAHQRLVDASAEMITIAQGGDAVAVADQVGVVGGSCKNCHDNFRLDTD
ncbi:MAG: cytochrome c [Erythrobacter sp.]|uniref:c-type cytochrome n=1 Tax=Erythrobacter sp. TaxID=1042 RepID=UPI0026371F08|nr:cytochrome c [Erythrobacter sp.]MDJ0977377.1 cytochrome c [Erythrobacter sp.]